MTWYLWVLASLSVGLLWSAGSGLLWYLGFHTWRWRDPEQANHLDREGVLLALGWPLVPPALAVFFALWLLHWPGLGLYRFLHRRRLHRQTERIERAHAERGR